MFWDQAVVTFSLTCDLPFLALLPLGMPYTNALFTSPPLSIVVCVYGFRGQEMATLTVSLAWHNIVPALAHSIKNIIKARPNEKMLGIEASPIVASVADFVFLVSKVITEPKMGCNSMHKFITA
jgi:hypothetical protein